MSPSTVPAAARPPPLPVAATARPAPPNTHPPARPPSWRRARPPAATATEARAPATPFSFLCLCPRDRLLARPITRPRPALCPPPLPRRVAAADRLAPSLGCRARWSQGSRLCRLARSRVSVRYGCRALANASRAAHPPARPVPGTYPAARLGCSAVAASPRVAAAGLRLHRVAQAALLRAEGPQSCRELPLQGWLSYSRLDAARAGGGTRARRPRRAPLRP